MNRSGGLLLMVGAVGAFVFGLVTLAYNGYAEDDGMEPVDTVPGAVVLFVIAAACAIGAFVLFRRGDD